MLGLAPSFRFNLRIRPINSLRILSLVDFLIFLFKLKLFLIFFKSVFKMEGKGSRARGFPGARAGAVDVELQELAI